MKNNKLIAAFAAAALLFNNMIVPLAVHADEEKKIYLNEGFGSYVTNAKEMDGWQIANSEFFSVSEEGGRDKVAKFAENGKVTLTKTFGEAISNHSVVSVTLKSCGEQPSLRISLMNGNNPVEFFSVQNGSIYLKENNLSVGGISPVSATKIDAVVDLKYGRANIYMNGKLALKEWRLGALGGVYNGIRFEQTGKASVGITAAAVYEGDEVDDKIIDNSFNPNTKSSFYLEQDGSDMTYFHSNYIANTILAYPLTFFDAKKGNSYTAEALINWKNPEKGDRIILTKGTDDTSYNDVYFNVDISKRAGYFPDPDKKYKYFMLSGDLMITDTSVGGSLMLLRDITSGSYKEFYLKMKNGTIYSHNNEKLSDALAINKNYHLECYVDLESHVYDVYLDGEMIGQDLAVPDSVSVPNIYRCVLDNGQGSWILDNWEFRGMAKRYGRAVDENGKTVPVVIRSSQFADNDTIKKYLADKIVFHGDGQLYYKDGKKIPFSTEAVYENNELYIAPEDFNSAYGTTMRYDAATGNYTDGTKSYEAAAPIMANGAELYPAKSLSIALGWGARHNGYGSMVIAGPDPVELIDTSDRDMPWFDSIYYNEGSLNSPTMRFTDAQEISNFVFYDRPNAEQIQDDFAKTMGENAQHPRLMITPDDVTRLRGLMETDGYFKNAVENLINHVEQHDMNRPLIYYGDSNGSQEMGGEDMRTLYQAFDFQNMERVACAYILTGDKKYSDKAISMMMNIVNTFPDLNPSHIIDLGSWLRTIAIIYDWCYDAMTEEDRAATVEFIKEKGLAVINRAYYAQLPAGTAKDFNTFQSASWFPTWKSNYTSYTQGGVVMGALAVAEYCPDLSFDTLEKALRAYEYEHFGFYPGGIWLEGKTYQTVINKNNAYAFGSMQSCLGTNYKMLEYKGMHESLRAMMAYGSLTGSFTFADDTDKAMLGGIDDSYQFYANYYDDPVLSMWRQLKLKNEYSDKYGTGGGWDPEPLDIIYYEPMAGDSILQNFDKASYFEGGEIFSVHENWLDKNATFFASAGGPTLHYHRHYDAGDFYYAKDGVTWSYDFGQGDYNVGSIWTRFGGRSEAHNTITINNSKDISMKESSFVPVIAQGKGEGGAYVVYDMKELYAHHGTEKMHRGFYIGDDYESLRVRDEMSFSKTVTGYWHFHTEADVKKIDDSTMLLTKDGKSVILHMNIEGDGFQTEFSVDKARPLPESPVLENDAQNRTNINQVRIKFQGKGDINITVEFYDVARDIDTTPISQWTPPEKTLVSNSSTEDFSYDLYMNGAKLESSNIVPIIDGYYNEFEIVPRSAGVKAELVDPIVKVAEQPMLVKLTSADGSNSTFSLVKYSKYGETIKKLLYNDLDVVSYDVSSEPETANGRTNMFDNDPSTRFCMYYDDATVTMDLGETKAVDGIALIVWKGDRRNYYFDLQTSTDGINFKTVGNYSSSGEVEDYEFYTFPTEQARYVRFIGHMNSEGDTNNLNELRVIQKK